MPRRGCGRCEGVKRELIVSTTERESTVTVEQRDGKLIVSVDGVAQDVDAKRVRPGTWSIQLGGRGYLVDLDRRKGAIAASVGAGEVTLEVEDALHRKLAQAAGTRTAARGERLVAPIAGKVVKVLVELGQVVEPGTPVIVLEAMKMENELVAERGGTVQTINKQTGQAVDTGDLLVELT